MIHPMVFHVISFLSVSLIVALSTSLIRLRQPRAILTETLRFFGTVVVCIAIFGVAVVLIEWMFLRRPW